QSPFSRSACTKRTPGISCGSRSTASTSRPRAANSRAWRPAPLATSSTGPRSTSSAQRETHADGASRSWCCFEAVVLLPAPDDALVERIKMALPVRAPVAALERAIDGVEILAPLAVAIADRRPGPGAVRRDGKGAWLLGCEELGIGVAPVRAQIRHGVDARERRETGDRRGADAQAGGDRTRQLAHPGVVVLVHETQFLTVALEFAVHQVQALHVPQAEAARVLLERHAQQVLVTHALLELEAAARRHDAPLARWRDRGNDFAQLLGARRRAGRELDTQRIFERREAPVAEIVVGARRQGERH